MLIDLHNDWLSKISDEDVERFGSEHPASATDLSRLEQGKVNTQFFVAFCDGRYQGKEAFDFANRVADRLQLLVNRYPHRVVQARDVHEIKQAVANGQIALLFAVEGGHMIDNDLDKLAMLHKRGMMYLTLTWNNSTDWATSAWDETHGKSLPDGGTGLSAKGKDIIRLMNQLGVIADVSHAGENTFFDVVKTTQKPIMATHSNAAALAPHYRNLTDEQLQAIRENGGVVGVNFYAGFVDTSFPERLNALIRKHADAAESFGGTDHVLSAGIYGKSRFLSTLPPNEVNALLPPLNRLIDHVDHIIETAGIDHVAIGSDYDGAEAYVRDLPDTSCFPVLLAKLRERGYTDDAIQKISGKNVLRVLAAQRT